MVDKIRDRNEAVIRAQELLDSDLVVFDTETTGLDDNAQIVEISAVDKDGKILMNTLIRPTVPIEQEAIDTHGITEDLVAEKGLPFHRIVPALATVFSGNTVASYNLEYDTRLVRQTAGCFAETASYIQMKAGIAQTACIMEIYARFWGEWKPYFQSYTWQGLDKAVEQCGLSFKGDAHRALADARAALDVLKYVAVARRRDNGL